MKNLLKVILSIVVLSFPAFSQMMQTPPQQQLQLPRESQRASVTQTVGDTNITIVYFRPNVKGREIFGKLVPYGEVWRTGANENTTFETSQDITVNGQKLAAGKYGLHTIPTNGDWTIIFNKASDAFGSFTYDQKQDALRVPAKPKTMGDSHETMGIEFENIKANAADIVIVWDKLKVPFTVNVGDVNPRVLINARKAVAEAKADDFRTPLQAASFVYSGRIAPNYNEAIQWTNQSIKARETFNGYNLKARIFSEMGNYKEALATGQKAIAFSKTAKPAVSAAATADLEKEMATWKTKI
ncbi:MAG: DUF2911 domain-containing protein [Pyrinomonadaceae bacterium]|nr:DUF2911 domain-containing protein [Pyrinomonadaceae bacterium]